ncbi:MAG: hypothetical protein D6E12_07215, partial [Desulfovibrio sp.]
MKHLTLLYCLPFALLFFPCLSLAQSLPDTRPDNAIRITQGVASEQNPCLSPDQRYLAFTRFMNGYNQGPSALVLLDLENGRERVLANGNDHDHVNLPGQCFSPDGTRIAYSSDASGNDEIWVLELASEERTQITRHQNARAYEPAFGHNGQHLTFELVENQGGSRVCSIALDSNKEQCLTSGEFNDSQPNPSPVTDMVLFQSDRGGSWGLWTVPFSGGEPSPFFDSDAEETDASWSPDGESVVFATDACIALSCA